MVFMGIFCQELVEVRVGNTHNIADKSEDRQISRVPEEVLGQQRRSIFFQNGKFCLNARLDLPKQINLEQKIIVPCSGAPKKNLSGE